MSGDERPDANTDSGSDDCFGDVGFMFDNALPKTRRSFQFGDISVAVRLVDDDPGAVQSGHYVWPAAPALSAYLVDRQSALPRGGKCLELGAGCGLAGLVAAQLPSITTVVFTDHDPGVLDLIRDSIAEQEQDPKLGGSDAAAKCCCVPLSWGVVGKDQRAMLADALARVVAPSSSPPPPNENVSAGEHGGGGGSGGMGGDPFFDLVIGSDVIYSVSVVAPLFQTVSGLLRPKPSIFPGDSDAPVDLSGKVGLQGAATATKTINPLCTTSSARGDNKQQEPVADKCDAEGSGGGAPSGESGEGGGPPRTSSQSFDGNRPLLGGGDSGPGGGAPVFLMSQSFGYDAETERAIEQACLGLGLVREVVWDELFLAPGGSQQEQKQQQEEEVQGSPEPQQQPPPQPQYRQGVVVVQATENRLQPTLNSSSTSSSNDGELLPLSKERRAGTKLQRFWRA